MTTPAYRLKGKPMTLDTVRNAVNHLAETSRGRNALRHLLNWLDDDGLGLDSANREAISIVLAGAWGAWPGSTRDFMRAVIDELAP